MLSGTVVLSSGDVPSEKIRLYCVCGSPTVSEGRTDSKGRYSLRVGRNSSLSSMDASIGGASHGPVPVDFMSDSSDAFRQVDLSGCTLETNAPGFRSKAIVLGKYRRGRRSDVGTLSLTPLIGDELSVLSER